jgi:LacI family transcriptional regulator
MPVTLRQLARHVGLSVPTVSQILGNHGESYRPETRQKVLDAARTLGYRPNAFARSVRAGRFGCLALVATAEGLAASGGLVAGLAEAAAARGHRLMVSTGGMDGELACDGLLVLPPASAPAGPPAVMLGSRQPSGCVAFDELSAGTAAAEALLELGHRRIGMVELDGAPEGSASALRLEGARAALEKAGLKPRLLAEATPPDRRKETLEAWLFKPGRPTAIVAADASAAIAAFAAAASLGIEVPRSMSIITFAAQPLCEPGVAMATMVMPAAELAGAAIDMLLKTIGAPAAAAPSRLVGAKLAQGATLARRA